MARRTTAHRLAHRYQIFVIDDEPLMLRSIQRTLQAEYDVVVAESARQGLSLIREQHFDVILCDLAMPHVSGQALFRVLRRNAPEVAATFAVMTGGLVASTEAALRRSGVPLVDKPFAIDDIRRLIEHVAAS